jgi:hypothetical protein
MSRVYSARLLAGKQISNLRIISVGILTSVAILTVILEFLPGLKANSLSRRDGHFFTGAGIAPDPRLRGLTMKTPNPRSSIRSPRERASFIELKSASTACSAFNFGMPVSSARRLMISS